MAVRRRGQQVGLPAACEEVAAGSVAWVELGASGVEPASASAGGVASVGAGLGAGVVGTCVGAAVVGAPVGADVVGEDVEDGPARSCS